MFSLLFCGISTVFKTVLGAWCVVEPVSGAERSEYTTLGPGVVVSDPGDDLTLLVVDLG